MPENPGKKPGVIRRKGRKASQEITEREPRVPLNDPRRVTASIPIPPAMATIRPAEINNASQTQHFHANPIRHPIHQYPNPVPIFAPIAPVGPGIPLPP